MIRDAHAALRTMSEANNAQFTFSFVPNTSPSLTEEERAVLPVPHLTQKAPAVFPILPPVGVIMGNYLLGKVPTNIFHHQQLARDWEVMRTEAKANEAPPTLWPTEDKPILVNLLHRRVPTEGVVVKHVMTDAEGHTTTELVFMELVRGHTSVEPMHCHAAVKYGLDGMVVAAVFVPQVVTDIISWTYLSEDGAPIRPMPNVHHKTHELFLDCEFDDALKKLISVGIVTVQGKVYYAYDPRVAEETKNTWIQENVNNVLLEVPNGAMVWDLERLDRTFQNFIEYVLEIEGILEKNLIIHTDFPTDVGYIAPLFHLGEGKRIGTMRGVTFQVDYVDPYPTSITNAKQHNAAWDAVALWQHMGYHFYKVIDDLTKAELRFKHKGEFTASDKHMKANLENFRMRNRPDHPMDPLLMSGEAPIHTPIIGQRDLTLPGGLTAQECADIDNAMSQGNILSDPNPNGVPKSRSPNT